MIAQPGFCRPGRKPRRPVFSERGSINVKMVPYVSDRVVDELNPQNQFKKEQVENILLYNVSFETWFFTRTRLKNVGM